MEWFLGEQHFPACKIAVSLVEVNKQVLPWPSSLLPPHPPGWWVKHGDSTENWLTSVEGHNPREKVPLGSPSNLSSKLASLQKTMGFWARTSRNHHQWDSQTSSFFFFFLNVSTATHFLCIVHLFILGVSRYRPLLHYLMKVWTMLQNYPRKAQHSRLSIAV